MSTCYKMKCVFSKFFKTNIFGVMTGLKIDNLGLQVSVSSAVGGTSAALTGGSFANGAVTGAFTTIFNHAMHDGDDTPEKQNKGRYSVYEDVYEYLKDNNPYNSDVFADEQRKAYADGFLFGCYYGERGEIISYHAAATLYDFNNTAQIQNDAHMSVTMMYIEGRNNGYNFGLDLFYKNTRFPNNLPNKLDFKTIFNNYKLILKGGFNNHLDYEYKYNKRNN